MNLNSLLVGSDNPERLVEYYTRLFGEPGWADGAYTGWRVGTGWITVAAHDEVSGKNAQPGRLIWNMESTDVQGDFEKLKSAGATVVREPYSMSDGDNQAWIATFVDPDGNYFQLLSEM